MKLSGVSITVSNLEESIRFYTEVLGCSYFDTIPTGMGRQAILTQGKMRISLFESNRIPAGKIIDISFLSKDLDADVKELEAKGASITRMPQQGSVARLAQLKDPDGVSIAVVQWNDGFEEKDTVIPM